MTSVPEIIRAHSGDKLTLELENNVELLTRVSNVKMFLH